jgi:hypothetical protein
MKEEQLSESPGRHFISTFCNAKNKKEETCLHDMSDKVLGREAFDLIF